MGEETFRTQGAQFWRSNIWAETNRMYSRSTYMGLNAGWYRFETTK